jgi:hypothetical protein
MPSPPHQTHTRLEWAVLDLLLEQPHPWTVKKLIETLGHPSAIAEALETLQHTGVIERYEELVRIAPA